MAFLNKKNKSTKPAVIIVWPIPANPANDSGTCQPITWYVPLTAIMPTVTMTPML